MKDSDNLKIYIVSDHACNFQRNPVFTFFLMDHLYGSFKDCQLPILKSTFKLLLKEKVKSCCELFRTSDFIIQFTTEYCSNGRNHLKFTPQNFEIIN